MFVKVSCIASPTLDTDAMYDKYESQISSRKNSVYCTICMNYIIFSGLGLIWLWALSVVKVWCKKLLFTLKDITLLIPNVRNHKKCGTKTPLLSVKWGTEHMLGIY